VEIAGQPVRLRVDPASGRFIELNASAAKRLDLANPARMVGDRPVDIDRARTQVGKVTIEELTTDELVGYAGRVLPLSVSWSDRDFVPDADGTIVPSMLPQDEVRFVRRPVGSGDASASLPLRWIAERGLLARIPAAGEQVDVTFSLIARDTIATAAAAAFLAEAHGGRLRGPVEQKVVMMGVSRPVRMLVFDRPVAVGPLRLPAVAARIFDWSGKVEIPAETGPDDELVVPARVKAQRSWAKLALGLDHLGACAELVWRRLPFEMTLVCPQPR
jgi:hypothetical protein